MPSFTRDLTENDLYLFREGTNTNLADVLGAHFLPEANGTRFAVWAPNSRSVSVIGSFNAWQKGVTWLAPAGSGIWQGFAPEVGPGAHYKYHIESAATTYEIDKADPLEFLSEPSPNTASVVCDL